MSKNAFHQILQAPIVSEKSTLIGGSNNQYVFKVHPKSNKGEIKAAVSKLFKVDVLKVTTSNMLGKQKRFKGRIGRRNHWKKAVVRLREGQMIDTVAS